MSRDLLTSPYGRFYHLPRLLAERGHDVHIALLSYKREPDTALYENGIHWLSVSLFNTGPIRYFIRANELMRRVRPNWVIGFSDTYYGILAQKLADRYCTRSLVDAYDNYEGYIPWLKPLHRMWRRSLSKATVVTAAGPSLSRYLSCSRPGRPTVVIPMAADPIGFVPLDRLACRKSHGLPLDSKLIGYCGGISTNRGVDILFAAFTELVKKRSDVELVLSGRKGRGVTLPASAHWLGYLPSTQVPTLLNSLDVLVVVNRHTLFGEYSHPVKLYEAMRCEIPVVATATAATRWILHSRPELLVEPNNPHALRERIEQALGLGRVDYGSQPDWESNADIFEEALGTPSAAQGLKDSCITAD